MYVLARDRNFSYFMVGGAKRFERHQLNARKHAQVRIAYKESIIDGGLMADVASPVMLIPENADYQHSKCFVIAGATRIEATYDAHEDCWAKSTTVQV